jgi:hypothetical protein
VLSAIATTFAIDPWLLGFWSGVRQIRGIEIIFTGNPDWREQGIAPGVAKGHAAN